jgi:hypothetical protein
MYDTWTVSGNPPASSASGTSVYSPTSPETGQYILFVHGWNMSDTDKDHFANTAYKRLWWQGYTGRFGAFDWPTLTGVTTFNRSEWIAWQSATALANKLYDLNIRYPNNVYIFAHSMGNFVVGEALKINNGQPYGAQAYVACQAAVPVHAYDPTITATWQTGTPSTPDDYAVYPPTGANYFNGVTSVGSRANFYNVNDWALSKWVGKQQGKPDSGYSWFGGAIYYNGSRLLFYPGDTDEIFAMCVQSPCYTLGATPVVDSFNGVNCAGLWGNDPFGQHIFDEHCWHSGEFYFSTVEQLGWWEALLDYRGFNLK